MCNYSTYWPIEVFCPTLWHESDGDLLFIHIIHLLAITTISKTTTNSSLYEWDILLDIQIIYIHLYIMITVPFWLCSKGNYSIHSFILALSCIDGSIHLANGPVTINFVLTFLVHWIYLYLWAVSHWSICLLVTQVFIYLCHLYDWIWDTFNYNYVNLI